MTLALLSIGTELTRGELLNTNAVWLAERLTTLGHTVREMLTVDDEEAHIVDALTRLLDRYDTIVCTGGLGPTTDDRTSLSAARVLGVPLVRDPKSLAHLTELLEARGLLLSESNAKQVDFPEGALIFDNPVGTAPGFSVSRDRSRAFFLPGVPAEMRVLFEDAVVPLLPLPAEPVIARRLRTFGLPESQVNDRLVGLEGEHGVTLGYRASNSEIEVKILTSSRANETPIDTEQRLDHVEALVTERLGPHVYGVGDTSLPREIGRLLEARGLTLGLAESCTGGLVSELITQIPGSSRYYQGGVCSYSNEVKIGLLGVPPELLEEHGAVSFEVAHAMAQGAARALHADVTLSLTGIAGPDGGTEEKPVGLVHWAVHFGEKHWHSSRVFRGDRAQVQRRAALAGLWSVYQTLRES